MPQHQEHDFNGSYFLKDYDYELPESRIAQYPAERRDASQLLVLDRATGKMTVSAFDRLGEWLPQGSLLVANQSKVVPARLWGRWPTGGKVECLLLTPLPLVRQDCHGTGERRAMATVLLRSSKGMRKSDTVTFSPDLELEVLAVGEFGRCEVALHWRGDLLQLIEKLGSMPLPPYIHRPAEARDHGRYQTVYASEQHAGSVAAPTAGLHFTQELRTTLSQQGFGWCNVTLYVGYGTFSPIRCEDIRRHRMHAEYVDISAQAAETINAAIIQGRPVVAVGTTSVRALEGVHARRGCIEPFKGDIDCYILPGHEFQVVNHCLTNFHLPKSSLLVMISAFAGRAKVMDAYALALGLGFRFFSYGDSMFII